MTDKGIKRPSREISLLHGKSRAKTEKVLDHIPKERAQRQSASKAAMQEEPKSRSYSGLGSASPGSSAQTQSGRPKKASKRVAPPPPSNTKPVPCPRCHSEATKFCYYNNYDPQQPRYYCKVRGRRSVSPRFGRIGFARSSGGLLPSAPHQCPHGVTLTIYITLVNYAW